MMHNTNTHIPMMKVIGIFLFIAIQAQCVGYTSGMYCVYKLKNCIHTKKLYNTL